VSPGYAFNGTRTRTGTIPGAQPLHCDARRPLQIIIIEVIVDRRNVIFAQELHLVPRLENVAHVVEPADPRGALPLVGNRENQLQAIDHPQIAPIGLPMPMLSGAEGALAKPSHAVRAAGEIIQIGRQRVVLPSGSA